MAKTFDHAVIYNGTFYPANTPIEDEKPTAEKSAEAPTEAAESPESGETSGEVQETEESAEAPTEAAEKAAKNGKRRTGKKPKSDNTD